MVLGQGRGAVYSTGLSLVRPAWYNSRFVVAEDTVHFTALSLLW